MADLGRGENERWVGVFLDVPGNWWKREKQDDLFVRLPGVEQIVGSGVGRAWAVFVRPIDQHSDDANALKLPTACVLVGPGERRLVRAATLHGYSRCRIVAARRFVPVPELPGGVEEGGLIEPTEEDLPSPSRADVLSARPCSEPFVVGAETRCVLIQLARPEVDGAETWRWSRQMDPAPVLDVPQNDVHVTFTGDGPIAMVRATLDDAPDADEEESTAEAAWERVQEEMEDRFDVLDRMTGPSMDWFGYAAPDVLRPRLTTEEEAALPRRVVRAVPVFDIAERGIDISCSPELCSAEDVAELNWGLVNGRTTVLRDWSEVSVIRERIAERSDLYDSHPELNPFRDLPDVRPPWNAVVRYEPEEDYRGMYFLGRVGAPIKKEWQLRVSEDDLAAFVACLGIGTLHAMREGVLPIEAGQWSIGSPSLWWLEGKVPHDIIEVIYDVHDGFETVMTEPGTDDRPSQWRAATAEEQQASIADLLSRLEKALARLENPLWWLPEPSSQELAWWERL